MDFNALYGVVATLFILIIVGFVGHKLGIIDEIASKRLSSLILKIGQPALLIYSLASAEYTADTVRIAGEMTALGFVFHVAIAIIAFAVALPIRRDFDERKITEFSLIFANCAFIGFPVFRALFGEEGVFMASFLIISFNVLLWTWGIAIFARKRNDIKITLKTVILNFGTVPAAIGFGLFLLKAPDIGFVTPAFILDACKFLSNLCTPVSLLICGALIATLKVKDIFTNWHILYFNAMRLVIVPLIVCLITKLLAIPYDYAMFFTAAAALPTAASVSMLAETHDIKPGYAGLAVGTSSLLCVVSLPLTLNIAQLILSL